VIRFLNRLNWNLFGKLFLMLVLLSSIPILAASFIMYAVSRDNLENEVCLSNLEILKQTQMALDTTLEATERISVQIIRNKAVQYFLNDTIDKNASSSQYVKNAINVADSFQEGVQYIERISIYSFTNNLLLSSGTQRSSELGKSFIDSYGNSIRQKGFSLWIEPDDAGLFGEISNSLQYVEFIFETFNKPQGIVVIKCKNDELAKLINEIYIRKSGYVFVLNNKGTVILGKNKLSDVFNPSEYFSEHRGETEGFYTINTGKQKLLVSFTTSRHNQWKYVAVLPAEEVQDKVSIIGETVLIVCFFFAMLAIVLSFVVSKGIYGPIASIESLLSGTKKEKSKLDIIKGRHDEFGRIHQELDKKIAKLKDYFFYRLVFGDFNDKEEIENQADYLEIPRLNFYAVAFINVAREEKDAAIEMINTEIRDQLRKYPVVLSSFMDSHDVQNTIVAILTIDKQTGFEDVNAKVKMDVRSIYATIKASIKIPLTIAVGNPYKGLVNLGHSYTDASEALQYKFGVGEDTVIFKSEISKELDRIAPQYYSPNQIINCLNSKDYQGLSNLLNEFKLSMKEKISSKKEYVYHLKGLLSLIAEHLNSLGISFNPEREQLRDVFSDFEAKFDNVDQAVDWIDAFTKSIIEKNAQTSIDDSSRRRIISQATDIIKREFDHDISLAYIANIIGISEAYCSKIFKEEVGINYKEYATTIRMNKAKELMASTNLTISQICRAVGYNNDNQFIKMFKKVEGVTPGVFRKNLL
jgi:two-component system, response regulator YesN